MEIHDIAGNSHRIQALHKRIWAVLPTIDQLTDQQLLRLNADVYEAAAATTALVHARNLIHVYAPGPGSEMYVRPALTLDEAREAHGIQIL